MHEQRKNYLTLSEVIKDFGYSKSYWYKKTSGKEINYYKIGKAILFDPKDIENFLTPQLIKAV